MNTNVASSRHGKGRTFPPEPLSPDEVLLLLRQCSTRVPTGLRGRALIVVLYRGGLRCFEALALKPADIQLDAGTIRVLHGKGDVARTVGIDEPACEIIGRYMETRKATLIRLGGADAARKAPLFCTLSKGSFGRRVYGSYVRDWLPRIGKRAGIEKRVHAHGLRHTLACELANENEPVHRIQTQLGHKNIATTSLYLRGLNPGDTVTAMKTREWEAPK